MPTRIVLRDGVPSTMMEHHQHHNHQQQQQQQHHEEEDSDHETPSNHRRYLSAFSENHTNANNGGGGGGADGRLPLRRIGSWENNNNNNNNNNEQIVQLGPLAATPSSPSSQLPDRPLQHIGEGIGGGGSPQRHRQQQRRSSDDYDGVALPPTPTSIRSSANHHHRRSSSTTKVTGFGGFRNSILEKGQEQQDDTTHENVQHIGRTDIRASPRLQGYLFNFTASMVLFVSVIQFYVKREHDTEIRRILEEDDGGGDGGDSSSNDNEFTTTFGTKVLTWKLYGALALSATGVFISLFVLLVHFDTVCFPKLWKHVFREGSKAERNLLVALLLFWFMGLYICTSSFSVGEVQANVYFTTWIAFGSTALNFGVWRSCSSNSNISEDDLLPPFAVHLWDSTLYDHPRETQHNWLWVFVFALIAALSITEFHANRADLLFLFGEDVQTAPTSEWAKGLSSTWCAVGISMISLFCNHMFQDPVRLSVGRCTVLSFDWRWVECLFILILLGLYTWIIIAYTGVNGVISGPSNPYFGVWGSFFCSIFTFGSWLKENKKYVQELS